MATIGFGGLRVTALTAAWGEVPPMAKILASGDMGYTMYQTPSFSNSVARGGTPPGNWAVSQDGELDLTDWTTYTGYHTRKITAVWNIYLEWDSDLSEFAQVLAQNINPKIDGTQYFITNILGVAQDYKLYVDGVGQNNNRVITPGPYTDYLNRWLTVIISTSDTSSDFTQWSSSSGSDSFFERICLFDSETGELIAKSDNELSYVASQWYNLADWPTTVDTNTGVTNGCRIQGTAEFGFDDQLYRISNLWFSLGYMFDPLQETDTSWRTQRPSSQIGQARALLNAQACEYVTVTGPQYGWKVSGDDRYSCPDDSNIGEAGAGLWTQTNWDLSYSDTIIPKDTK